MQRINRLRIRGFKSLQKMEVEPSGINIITGRNNSGKTSLLESASLLFDPSEITEFGENVQSVINVHQNSCSIRGEYFKSQMTLDDFKSNAPLHEQREVAIRSPRRSEATKYFMSVLSSVVDVNTDSSYFLSRFQGEEFSMEFSEGQVDIEDLLRESLTEFSEEQIWELIGDECVVIEVDGEEFPYIYLGNSYDSIRTRLIERSVEKFKNSAELSGMGEDEPEFLFQRLESTFFDLLVPRFGRGRFINEKPPSLAGVRFIESVVATPDQIDPRPDDAAVRVSNIEEYLKSNKIIENLDDFSFSSLVFEENGEKYDVPYEFMGEGFKAIVGVLWELFNPNNQQNVLLIEEPETHMHPGYINTLVHQLINISRENQIQLFITTHNVDFIDAFFSKNLNDQEISYLKEEFKLIQFTENLPKSLGYEDSKEQIKELQLDLRGI